MSNESVTVKPIKWLLLLIFCSIPWPTSRDLALIFTYCFRDTDNSIPFYAWAASKHSRENVGENYFLNIFVCALFDLQFRAPLKLIPCIFKTLRLPPFYHITRNATRCNNRDDLLHLTSFCKFQCFRRPIYIPVNICDEGFIAKKVNR